eukprot:1139285-Pelagomonas_calceolata.AAC.4
MPVHMNTPFSAAAWYHAAPSECSSAVLHHGSWSARHEASHCQARIWRHPGLHRQGRQRRAILLTHLPRGPSWNRCHSSTPTSIHLDMTNAWPNARSNQHKSKDTEASLEATAARAGQDLARGSKFKSMLRPLPGSVSPDDVKFFRHAATKTCVIGSSRLYKSTGTRKLEPRSAALSCLYTQHKPLSACISMCPSN